MQAAHIHYVSEESAFPQEARGRGCLSVIVVNYGFKPFCRVCESIRQSTENLGTGNDSRETTEIKTSPRLSCPSWLMQLRTCTLGRLRIRAESGQEIGYSLRRLGLS